MTQEIAQKWKKARRSVAAAVRQYRLNRSFYAGNQNVAWDAVHESVTSLPYDDRRPDYSVNLIGSRCDRLVGKITATRLEFLVSPSGGDDTARWRARNTEMLLRWRVDEGRWDSLRADNAKLMILGGTSIIGVEPDPEGVEKLSVFAIDEAMLQPGVRTPSDAQWWVACTQLPVDIVKATYGVTDIKPSGNTDLLPIPGMSASETETVAVYRYYERPNPTNETGRIVHATDNTILWESEWVFPTETLNAFVFTQTPLHGTWWGTTVVTNARKVQVQYNDLRRSILEHITLFRPKVMVPIGTVTDLDQIDSQAVIEYIPSEGQKPDFLVPPPLPRSTLEQPLQLIQEIDEQLFTNEVSRGVSPGDRYSGVAIAALAESNDSPLVSMLREERYRWADIAKFVVAMYGALPPSATWSAVLNLHGISAPMSWNPTTLDMDSTVTVKAESDFPQSPAVLQARITELVSRFPQLAEAIDPQRLLSALRIPGSESLTGARNSDARAAQWENMMMASGEVLIPRSFEDHAVHIAEHNWQRRQPEFRSLPPDIQNLFEEHVLAHEAFVQAEAQQQAILNELQPGLAAMPQANQPPGSAVPPPSGGERV